MTERAAAEELIASWRRGNIQGYFLEGREPVRQKLFELIPPAASVGFSGSMTLQEMDVIAALESRGNKVFNHAEPGLSREESMALRNRGASADFFLSGANAIAATGELVFLSAYGHRISGIANAAHAVIIAGLNKISPDLPAALARARGTAVPQNCRRLGWETPCRSGGVCDYGRCRQPEYRRMCCQLLVIEAEAFPGRLTVILVDEPLGF